MIMGENLIECALCGTKSTAKEWDETSYKYCLNREMRRAYKSICDEKIFKSHKQMAFKCPHCGKWIYKQNLLIYNNFGILRADIGNEPLCKIHK